MQKGTTIIAPILSTMPISLDIIKDSITKKLKLWVNPPIVEPYSSAVDGIVMELLGDVDNKVTIDLPADLAE